MSINQTFTEKKINNEQICWVDLSNNNGIKVRLCNYGAIINKLIVLNKDKKEQDIVLGFDTIDEYFSDHYLANYPYLGAIVGRYANRIKNGKFTIDQQTYQLAQNNGSDCLHGGKVGFDKKVWDIVGLEESPNPKVTMRYTSKDGEENFPGNLTIDLSFELTDSNELKLEFKAHTDKATAINLTHHGYFNLHPTKQPIDTHVHQMNASHYLEQDANYVVTGKLLQVEGTLHDFRTPKTINHDWDANEGYDQTYVLDKPYGELQLATTTTHPESGIILEVHTTEPVAHLYTAKYLASMKGKGNEQYGPYGAFCVETQHHPNAINIPEFPSTVLRPGETYKQTTVYKIKSMSAN